MTKKLFLTLVSAVFLAFMLAGCGDDKKENETPDAGDSGTVSDEDITDSGDTATVTDEDPADTGSVTDEDPADTGSVTDEDPADTGSVTDEDPADSGSDFEAVDVGDCLHDEPAISFKDRVYTGEGDEFSCKEYVEVTEKADNSIRFNWFGEMHCGYDWEYGYKVEGIVENVLKVNILERDTEPEIAADCDSCCYLMPIEFTASTAEEIESIQAIEINYAGKNHTAYFEID